MYMEEGDAEENPEIMGKFSFFLYHLFIELFIVIYRHST